MSLKYKMNSEFYEKYSSEEQEVIALIQKTVGASRFNDELNMLATTLGMVFCKDNKVDIRKGRLNWLISEEERNSGKGWDRFQKGQICRIKVRKLLDIYAPKNITVDEFNAWCVVDVLESNVTCLQLEKVWEDYQKPVVIDDELLGTMTLNREFDMFEGSIKWNEKDIFLMIEVESDDKSAWEPICKLAKDMIMQLEKWDNDMREFSAKELTSLANEWAEEGDTCAISEEQFTKRISLSELSFSFEDAFTAIYSDDDMFWGHVIEICGSLSGGIESANIAG